MTDDFDLSKYVINGAALDARLFPPLRWAVPGLIPEGFGLVTGPPKAGKSWFVGGIALDTASARPALGKIDSGPPKPTLYLALEDGERRLQGRCRKLLGDGVPIPDALDFVTQIHAANVLTLMQAWLDQHAGENPLIILDTLGRVMPNSAPGESAYSRDYRIGAQLKSLTDRHPGSTLLVVHHVRKAAGDDWMDSTSGTNGLNGAADFTINLSRNRNEDTGLLKVTGRDVVEAEYAVRTDDGRWSLEGDALVDAAAAAEQVRAAHNLGDRSSELLAWVIAQPEPVSPKDVEDALGFAQARQYLKRLVDQGRLVQPSRGKYAGVTTVTSVTFEESTIPEVTQVTDVTPRCSACSNPMRFDDGTGTHPTCEAA